MTNSSKLIIFSFISLQSSFALAASVDNFELFQAAQDGDLKQVMQAIERDRGYINHQYSDGRTLLRISVDAQKPLITEYLLKQGADKNIKAKDVLTPLCSATARKSARIVGALLANGDDPNQMCVYTQGVFMETSFPSGHALSLSPNPEVLRVLLKHGARFSPYLPESACTALAQLDYPEEHLIEKMKVLLEFPDLVGKIDNLDGKQLSCLMSALSGSKEKLAAFLIEQNADVNRSGFFGATPLHIAARRGLTKSIDLLVSKGAKLNALDDALDTPVNWASDVATVHQLQTLGASTQMLSTPYWAFLNAYQFYAMMAKQPIIAALVIALPTSICAFGNQFSRAIKKAIGGKRRVQKAPLDDDKKPLKKAGASTSSKGAQGPGGAKRADTSAAFETLTTVSGQTPEDIATTAVEGALSRARAQVAPDRGAAHIRAIQGLGRSMRNNPKMSAGVRADAIEQLNRWATSGNVDDDIQAEARAVRDEFNH